MRSLCPTVKAWLLGSCLVLVSLLVHLAPPLSSMLNMPGGQWDHPGEVLSSAYLANNIEIHRTIEPAFVKRPLTTWAIDVLEQAGFSPGPAFIFQGMLLFLVGGVLVWRNAYRSGLDQADAQRSQIWFHLLPTVLFAFFPPMYTYDEPLQYVFLFLATGALVQGALPWCVLWLSVAMVARESTVLLIPSLMYIAWSWDLGAKGVTWWHRARRILAFSVPVVVYGLFLRIYLPYLGIGESSRDDLASRLQFFDFNFKDGDMSGESLSFAFLAMGLPLFIILRYALRRECPEAHRRWIRAMLVGLVLNTAVVLVATKAREARLFVLPLLLVVPLLGVAWRSEMATHGSLRNALTFFRHWHYALGYVFFTGFVILISDHIFSLSDGVPSANLFHEYFIAQALLMGIFVCDDVFRRQEKGRALTEGTN